MAGRPSSYSEKIAERICDRLIEGESLVQICADENMPGRKTVYDWMEAHPDFHTKCARAREGQADYMDHRILDVANSCTAETAHADKVKISAYQSRASKLAPKKYGDKLELAGDPDSPIRHEVTRIERVIIDPADRDGEGV